MTTPPLTPPATTTGNPPVLNLENCQDNATGSSALTPVTTFVRQIKALKDDPDHQIAVGAIAAPASPYAVGWVPPASPPQGVSGEVWPNVMHSCGSATDATLNPMAMQMTTDGSFGDPGVRISQFVQAFTNHALGSICDANYQPVMTAIATQIGGLLKPLCLSPGRIQLDAQGQPMCAVTNHLTTSAGTITDVPVANCNENGAAAPCWTLDSDPSCAAGSVLFHLLSDAASMSAADLSSTLECSVCGSGTGPGC